MTALLMPVLYTVLLWWSATGIILFLNRREPRSFPASLAGASLLLAAGFFGLWDSRDDGSVAAVYVAFTSALLVWGWLEMSFLMGFITGPRRIAMPERARGTQRFLPAVQAILYHEFALLVGGGLLCLLTLGGSNHFGIWTFTLLWVMRLSAKLNLFLGVRNLGLEYLPAHMKYLGTYFRQRAMNPLFPLSLAGASWTTLWFAAAAGAPDADEGTAVGFTVLATLSGLAALEHIFLVLPLRSERLWSWSLADMEGARGEPALIPTPAPVADSKASP
jgi:putative photosynthetic complex assembly protein 2